MWKKLNNNLYEIKIDNDIINISLQKVSFHSASIDLIRLTNNNQNLNLFTILRVTKEIIFEFKNNNSEITEYSAVFINNGIIDMDKWIKICQFYIGKSVKVGKIGSIIIFNL